MSSERQKANFSVVALAFLWFSVLCITATEKPIFGQSQLTLANLLFFTMGTLVLIAYFLSLGRRALPDGVGELPKLLAGIIGDAGVEPCKEALVEPGDDDPGPLKRILTNLWVPVTLEFLLAGWLIYASGGIPYSPYTPVPVAMMIIGQSLYDIRPVQLESVTTTRGMLELAMRIARYYWYPLTISVCLFAGLEFLQARFPLVTKPVPSGELVLTTLWSLFVCMCTTYVTRCFDQRLTQSTS